MTSDISQEEFEDLIVRVLKDEGVIYLKRRRRTGVVTDFWSTSWGLLITNPATNDCSTREGRLFRRRFRVPFPVFQQVLVPLCAEKNIFQTHRKSSIPDEIKLMMCLRILGRNSCADDACELSGIKESTCNSIFKTFLENFVKHISPMFVKIPEEESLFRVMEVYKKLGFPGTVGSMDCTRLKWTRCPKEYRQIAQHGVKTIRIIKNKI